MRTDRVELIEHRQDVLNICGIWVRVIKGIEERAVFRTKLFLQFICPLAQRLNFFRVFLLSSLIDLHTETVQLAVGLALRFIAPDAADNFWASDFNLAVSGCWACAYGVEISKDPIISSRFIKSSCGSSALIATAMRMAGVGKEQASHRSGSNH